MNNSFSHFFSQLKESNVTLGSLTDFEKVTHNVAQISLKLHQLNHLLGREDWEKAVREVFEENEKCFAVLPILVAVRGNKVVLNKRADAVGIESYLATYEGVCEFIKETDLAKVFSSHAVTNLVDYVFGVEVGLDTNARKNRGGTTMANHVAHIFDEAHISYRTEVVSTEFPEIETLGRDLKRFDFVIEHGEKIYLIETNFYNPPGGSKLNETARSYVEIAQRISRYPRYEFVWITDGQGWKSAKNKLEEAFDHIPSMYNLTSLSQFIERIR